MSTGEKGILLAELSDELLLQRLCRGETEPFEELFRRHYDRVYGLLFRLVGTRHEAEELAQEVFLRLYRRPPARASNVTGWLYRVAMNTGYNALRSNSRRRKREQKTAQRLGAAPTVEERVTGYEEQRRVRAALACLPERSAQLLLLRQMGLSYRELAEAVGVAPGSVGTLLSRAAQAFRKAYDELEKD